MAKKTPLRTRFAPSPTGPFHVGSLRTALFNYLLAKQAGGSFILRIEDTDRERSKKEYEMEIFKTLEWTGFTPDEGPIEGGNYGPYRQSERTEIYRTYLQQLLKEKKAYYCFCTAEELEAQKQDQASRGEAPRYTGKCRSLSGEAVEKNLKEEKASAIRFSVAAKTITFQDLIRDKISFDVGLIGDIVIAKDLDTPLYNFTVVVDDHEMQITHVVRGEDHISNTPKQILLQEALGLRKLEYAHLPLLLGADRAKLSKRHGRNSIKELLEDGYLPEAMINFLALLGWNPGNDREIFSLEELIKEFSLDRVQKGGAIFNIQKLNSINAYYLKKKSLVELTRLAAQYLPEITPQIVRLYQERLSTISEITQLADFFFQEKLEYPKEQLQWKNATDEETREELQRLEIILSEFKEGESASPDERAIRGGWTKEGLEKGVMPEAEKEKDRGCMLWPFRVALTGKKASPGPFEVAEILGKQKTLQRIKEAYQKL